MARSRSPHSDESAKKAEANPQATRETVESIVVAVILAFLFRAFVAEAFVIPTGSMAPTLQGRHLDLQCEQCGYQYRTGASIENSGQQVVQQATCPICRFPAHLDRRTGRKILKTNRDSFNGDRILVSKFAYELGDPQRWDVIVFKFPGNAKQNYIKRLIGLPGETVKIEHGDIFVGPTDVSADQREYQVARKPPSKLRAMLQLVDDTRYIGELLQNVNWPSRWQPQGNLAESERWQVGANGHQFAVAAASADSWLRYHHIVPWSRDWQDLIRGVLPERVSNGLYRGQLITDYYAYNDFDNHSPFGDAWVGDLSVQCNVEVQSDTGELLLDLVEGGVNYTCRIEISSGLAELTIDGGERPFEGPNGETASKRTGATRIRGKGRHELQLANVDDQLLLWVDSRLIEFDGPTTYVRNDAAIPVSTPPGRSDLAPVGVGARNAKLNVTRLRVLRDVYYQAANQAGGQNKDYYGVSLSDKQKAFQNPSDWQHVFANRRSVSFQLGEDQFFPMGDNSPQSKDARIWHDPGRLRPPNYVPPPNYVERRLLLGKALLIYWPHAWRPFLPNFKRMGFIR